MCDSNPVFNGAKILELNPTINLAKLARRLEITRQTMHGIVQRKHNPSVNLALRIASELGCTVEDLSEQKNLS